MTERQLFVTLGHNSSAVLVEDGVVIRGYEQERIDRRKSSSAYPKDAIERCTLGHPVDEVFVSHWFDDCSLETNKYLDSHHLECQGVLIHGPKHHLYSHHDLHARSAVNFFESHDVVGPFDVLVVDGFGTLRECLSVYSGPDYRLVHRTYGYNRSLGLMYQYVTDFLGMKMNQDEYKLLGYESHVLEYAPLGLVERNLSFVRSQAMLHAERMLDSTMRPALCDRGSLINMEALKAAQAYWYEMADHWRAMWASDMDERGVRACVAFCAQAFLEAVVDHIVTSFNLGKHRPLVLTGGCFLNVKLNRSIAKRKDIQAVLAHPICGDQGAAFGHVEGLALDGLKWGDRAIGIAPLDVSFLEIVGRDSWVQRCAALLDQGHIVNVVRGAMEFGPRALCNTTTFARPTLDNVSRINLLNERDEAMPMAPCMTRHAAMGLLRHGELFKQRVSDRYMITTVAINGRPPERLMGIAHKDPIEELWTARPQIVYEDTDGQLHRLLELQPDETLINTSFNYHGEPIVLSQEDAVRTHINQCKRALRLGIASPTTLLVQS